jgi:hypothetical protein
MVRRGHLSGFSPPPKPAVSGILPQGVIMIRFRWRARSPRPSFIALLFVISLVSFCASPAKTQQSADRPDSLPSIRAGFAIPAADARPMMRWWWFGPAVEKPELARELRTMKAGGIGGAEIQPVYALEIDDTAKGFRNLPYLSKDFLDMVGFAAQTAHDLGIRLNLTLASGWPYGGSYVPINDAAGRLRVVAEAVPSGATSLPVPSVGNGEKLLAAFLAEGTPDHYNADPAQQLQSTDEYRLTLPNNVSGPHVVLFFISSHTGQQVKRARRRRGRLWCSTTTAGRPSRSPPENRRRSACCEPCGKNRAVRRLQRQPRGLRTPTGPPDLSRRSSAQRRGYDLTPHLPALVAGDIAR